MNHHTASASHNSRQKIVVIGGTGLIGKPLVERLRALGHEVVAASPSKGINAVTGEGLADALAGAHTVIDVANSPSFENQAVLEFFQRSSSNLVAAEIAAGVRHHVALSVVGTDRVPDSGYFLAKLAQETLIKASPIPFTIVRATQFFEFAPGIAYGATQGQTVRLPAVLMQPIAAADVSAAVAETALAAPLNGVVELAGPEPIPQDAFVRRFLAATGDTRTVVTDPTAGYFGAAINDQSLTPTAGLTPLLGATRYTDWLNARAVAVTEVATSATPVN
ncbi:MAG: SDR family oxidoreductase [Rariglobus sp.]